MVKFGRYLQAMRAEGLADKYVDYKQLKEIISALSSVEKHEVGWDTTGGIGDRSMSMSMPMGAGGAQSTGRGHGHATVGKMQGGQDVTEADFFTLLEGEMRKVDEFTTSSVKTLEAKLTGLENRVVKAVANGKGLSASAKSSLKAEAKDIGNEFLKLEKYANLNFLAFHKILKKHDKQLAVPCRQYYLTRLHGQSWVNNDFSGVLVQLSQVHTMLREESDSPAADAVGATGSWDTSMEASWAVTKFWVRYEDVSRVKHVLIQHLPVSLQQTVTVQNTIPDSTPMMPGQTLPQAERATSLVILVATFIFFLIMNAHCSVSGPWYGDSQEMPAKVYVERKGYRKNALWDGERSAKQRIAIRSADLKRFFRGDYTRNHHLAMLREELKSTGSHFGTVTETDLEAKADEEVNVLTELHRHMDAKLLRPVLRTSYDRVAYQRPGDTRLRISLDTSLTMAREQPMIPSIVNPESLRKGINSSSDDDEDDLTWLDPKREWSRNYTKFPLVGGERTMFPHAVLIIRLRHDGNWVPPQWLLSLIQSNQVATVHKFSKYVHGIAVLLKDDVQQEPFWIEDASIYHSVVKTRSIAATAVASAAASKNNKERDKASMTSTATDENHPLMKGLHGKNQNAEAATSKEFIGSFGRRDGLLARVFANRISPYQPMSLSKPRHIPMKVDPKVWFANERTLVSWLQMSVTLGIVAAGLLGYKQDTHVSGSAGYVSTLTEESTKTSSQRFVGLLLLPLAVIMAIYSTINFFLRSSLLRKKQVAPFMDMVGPGLLSFGLFVTLAVIFYIHV